MFFSFNGDGRVMISAEEKYFPDMIELDPPDGFTPDTQANWLYIGGAWVHDPLPVEEAGPSPEERLEKLEEENEHLKEALDLLLSGEVAADG